MNYARWRTTTRTGPDLNFYLSMVPNAPSTARRSVPRCPRRPGRGQQASAPVPPSGGAATPRVAAPAAPEQHTTKHVLLVAGLEPAALAMREPPNTPAEQARSVPRRADETDSSARPKKAPPTSPPRHRHLCRPSQIDLQPSEPSKSQLSEAPEAT